MVEPREDKPVACRCPYCDAAVEEPGPICAVCEIVIVECLRCGKPVRDDAVECPHCGEPPR